jgi:hypothetical protein
MVKAAITNAPSAYEYLQWSFNDPDNPALESTPDNKLKFVSGFAPAANESTAILEHDTNLGAKTGQKVYVYSVNSSGSRPSDPALRTSAWFVLDATL